MSGRESIRPGAVDDAIERGARALLAARRDGHWEGEMRWCPMLTAQYVIAHAFLGRPVDEPRKRSIVRYFETSRVESGVWGLHDHAGPSLFTTSLVYTAARLCGVSAEDPLLDAARRLFAGESGIATVPTWGRAWLALLGLYSWDGVHPMPPELWALPERFPAHPSRLYCHTRQIYLGLSLLRAAEPVARETPLLRSIRDELYPATPYASIDFRSERSNVTVLDRTAPEHPLLSAWYGVASLFERMHGEALRNRVGRELRERIRYELETTDHMALSPVSGMLGILALHIANPSDPAIEPALAALEEWAFDDDDGGYRLTGARSQTWDTAFALSSLAAAGESLPPDAVRFLVAQQIDAPFPRFDWAYRLDPTGGFCFAHVGHGWPVSDCTAEALLALFDARIDVDEEVFHRGVRFLLQCQNQDGGFGSYEARRTEVPLEALNPSEMFLDCMTEGSYVECTASCIAALARYVERFPGSGRAQEARTALGRAAAQLRRAQRADGAWDGVWGVSFVYGTLFGIRGLRAAGALSDDPAITKAVQFLVHRQRPDGGYGEHESGALLGRYIGLTESQVVQTAWAFLGMLESGATDVEVPMHRAARYLMEHQEPDGSWPKERMAGVFFRTALVDYDLYRYYFPVWALGSYRRHLESVAGRGRVSADGSAGRAETSARAS
jgi:lanosterol synthase